MPGNTGEIPAAAAAEHGVRLEVNLEGEQMAPGSSVAGYLPAIARQLAVDVGGGARVGRGG